VSRPLRVFVVYEYGVDRMSFCSGHIRLLRPLSHPRVRERVRLSSGRHLDGGEYDVVIVERLWRPDVTVARAERLIDEVRRAGARLVYAQDDNIFDLHHGVPNQTWLTDEKLRVMERFAAAADGLLVSTPKLADRLRRYNDNLAIVSNALDERLLAGRPVRGGGDRVVIGYMGTRSHDEDLLLVAPALRRLRETLGDRLELQLVGGVAQPSTLDALGDLRVRVLAPPDGESDYPLFLTWFTSTARWDVGLAPLRDNVYNACKSDIKLLDYGALGCAGLYSRLAPYEGITDGERGLLVDNTTDAWFVALHRLATDPPLRASIARAARAHLVEERTLARRAPEWPDALERLLAGRRP
jgi:glycosyltransferase involved in cell wall biosynthesis